MTQEDDDAEELILQTTIELHADEEAPRRRRPRRRKRGLKKGKEEESVLRASSAVEILTRIARDSVESSPSSFEGGMEGRKMSALELDDIIEESESQLHISTATPGSLDSSLSVWELGSIEGAEDELLRFETRPIIHSARMQPFSIEEDVPKKQSSLKDIGQITAGIEAAMVDMAKGCKIVATSTNRLCLPLRPQSNRLCMSVPENHPVLEFFGSLKTSVASSVQYMSEKLVEAQFALPSSMASVLASLETHTTSSSAPPSSCSMPILNRRQRRLVEGISKQS